MEDEDVGGDHREGCGRLTTPGAGRGTRSPAEDGPVSGTRHFTPNYREIFLTAKAAPISRNVIVM